MIEMKSHKGKETRKTTDSANWRRRDRWREMKGRGKKEGERNGEDESVL